jgi:hypothetical protein
MKKLFLFILLFSFFSGTELRAQATISGVVNDYTEVLSIDSLNQRITVGDALLFSSGDLVLLIQMQGASIIEVDSDAFGRLDKLNGVGNWELHEICEIEGNTIRLKNNTTREFNPGEGLATYSSTSL